MTTRNAVSVMASAEYTYGGPDSHHAFYERIHAIAEGAPTNSADCTNRPDAPEVQAARKAFLQSSIVAQYAALEAEWREWAEPRDLLVTE